MARARGSKALAGALLALGLWAGPALADAPVRVVSMNLCTDQLAMMLAAPGQLISVSDIASDPLTSPMHETAQTYPANHGSAEEIFLMSPDLVLAGVYSDPVVVGMLRRLGVRVEQIALVETLEDIPARLRDVGAVLGREAAAEAEITAFLDRLDSLGTPDPNGPLAAFYYPNGYTLGTETLSHEILTAAGFRHLATVQGRRNSGRLALEELVLARPDLVITSQPYPGASRSEDILSHPALRAATGPNGAHVASSDWTCGTPHVLRALEALNAAREVQRQ